MKGIRNENVNEVLDMEDLQVESIFTVKNDMHTQTEIDVKNDGEY